MNKRTTALLLSLSVLLSSCANRPGNIDEAETETEIVYEEPKQQFLDDLFDAFLYLNGPDSVFCYTDPVIKEEDYVLPEDLEYDMKAKKETRFISCNQYVDYPLTMVYADGTEATYSNTCPNAVYLTEADGKRTKLCPFEECREAYGDDCLHLDIDSNAVVYGDAVYFLWDNLNINDPDNPNRSKVFDFVCMLMRYNLDDHTVEKVLDLENLTEFVGADFGLLYLMVRETLTDSSYMILLDTENDLAAKAPLSDLGFFSGNVYLEDDGFYILEYARGWRKCDPLLRFEKTVSGLPSEYRVAVTDRGFGVKLVLNGTEEQVVLDGYSPWIVTEDWIFATPYSGDRTLYRYTAKQTEEWDPVVSRTGTKVVRFPRNENGTCNTAAGTTVFTEGVSSLDEDEAIYRMEPYGNSVRVVTVRPPDDDSDQPVWRRYILTKNGAEIDGEGLMIGNSYDSGVLNKQAS